MLLRLMYLHYIFFTRCSMPKSVALIDGPTDIHIKQSRLESTLEHQIPGTAAGSNGLLELAEPQKRSRADTHGSGKRSTKSQLSFEFFESLCKEMYLT